MKTPILQVCGQFQNEVRSRKSGCKWVFMRDCFENALGILNEVQKMGSCNQSIHGNDYFHKSPTGTIGTDCCYIIPESFNGLDAVLWRGMGVNFDRVEVTIGGESNRINGAQFSNRKPRLSKNVSCSQEIRIERNVFVIYKHIIAHQLHFTESQTFLHPED